MPIKEKMAAGFAVYAYGCALGGFLAGLFAPTLVSFLLDSFHFSLGDYAMTFMFVMCGSVLGGFIWGGIGGLVMGLVTDPQIMFNRRPKIARLWGGLMLSVPIFVLFLQASANFAAAFLIGLIYFIVAWVTISYVSLTFVDTNIGRKYDRIRPEEDDIEQYIHTLKQDA